jgi:hypothetical protein
VSPDDVRAVTDEVMAELGPEYEPARTLLEQVAADEPFVEFLTIPAYDRLLEVESARTPVATPTA